MRLSSFAPLLVAASAVLLLVPQPLRGAAVEPTPLEVVDLHVDLSYQANYKHRAFAAGSGQYPAAALRRAGVRGVVLPLYIPRDVSPSGPRARDLETSYARVFGLLGRTEPYALPGCSARPGAVSTWLSFEGAAPLAADPDAVSGWVARGVRLFGLVHSYDNALASSSGARGGASFGLTDAGRRVVERIHAAGGIVDVSHASDRATMEIVRMAIAAKRPVVASHSNARRLAAHPRNLDDEQLRAIARTGGLVGVNFHSPFLARGRAATLDDVVRHVRYLVRLIGAEHVAVGSDFEGDIRPPPELAEVTGYQRLARALLAPDVGLTRAEVEAILAKNALRLLCGGERR